MSPSNTTSQRSNNLEKEKEERVTIGGGREFQRKEKIVPLNQYD